MVNASIIVIVERRDGLIEVKQFGNHKSIDEKKDTPSECTCALCLEEFESESWGVIRLKCGHEYHASCFQKFIDYNLGQDSNCELTCPLCRYVLIDRGDNIVVPRNNTPVRTSPISEANASLNVGSVWSIDRYCTWQYICNGIMIVGVCFMLGVVALFWIGF